MFVDRDENNKIVAVFSRPQRSNHEFKEGAEISLNESDYSNAVQEMLDEKAQSMGYDNIFTAVTYADDPTVEKFQLEGAALRRWRSLVWEYAYAVLAQVESGGIEQPTIEDFIAGAPVYE